MKNNIIIKLFCLALLVSLIYSCGSKNDIEAIGEIRIHVNLPDDFNSTAGLIGKQVMLKNRYEKHSIPQ